MKNNYLSLILLALLAMAACSPGARYERIAEEACDCLRPLATAYEEMNTALDNNDMDALQRYSDDIEAASEEVEACADRMEEKYGLLEGELGKHVKAAMQSTCPDIIAIINEAESELVK